MQQLLADTVPTGMNLAVSGMGGTGKTFTVTQALQSMIHKYPLIFTRNEDYYRHIGVDPQHKYIAPGVPGVLYLSYTNPAVTVLRRNIPTKDLVIQYRDPATGDNTIRAIKPSDLALTVNKLLQFRPADAETAANLGISQGTFYPYRDRVNMLPPEITTIVLDEVGQLEIKLMLQLINAIDLNTTQLIFIGDICQTGASYGPSTLIRALAKLPRVAFDKTYRFAGELLAFANEVNTAQVQGLDGGSINRRSGEGADGDLINIGFFTPKEEKNADAAIDRVKTALFRLVTSGRMCLYTDLFIIPQKSQDLSGNVVMGSLFSLLDRLYGRPTFFVNSNAEPIILAAGDSILYNNQVGMVLDLGVNPDYTGDGRLEPLYSPSRDVDTWCLLYDNSKMGTVDKAVTRPNYNAVADSFDKVITTPVPKEENLTALLESMDMPDDMRSYGNEEEDEEDKRTQQLTHSIIVLNVTAIDDSFVTYTPASVDALYKAFFKELLDNCLFRHNSRQTTDQVSLSAEDLDYYDRLILRLGVKYNIPRGDITLQHLTRTSELSSTGVKYNWRTVQQTQGSQAYSVFSVFHRKCHVAGLLFRENLYTAYSRSMACQYGLVSKALLDGSLSAGGVNGQKYPGLTVKEKLKRFISKTRTVSRLELELDKKFDIMLQINAKRKEYFAKHGVSMLLDSTKDLQKTPPKDPVESAIDQLDLGRRDDLPF